MLRAVVAVLVMALGEVAAATALPGDPASEPLVPAEGATVAAVQSLDEGIEVQYSCPLYRTFDSDTGANLGDWSDYDVRFARSAADLAGRFVDSDPARATNAAKDRCASVYATQAHPPAQSLPGTVYWQVFRSCSCDGGYETGRVRSFVIRAGTPRLRVVVQSRAYAGYPIAIGLQAAGVPNGSAAVLERASGKGHKTLFVGKVSAAKAEAIATLPVGRARLRLACPRGTQTDVSPVATVRVRTAAGWQTSGRDDGNYRSAKGDVTFSVTGRGRTIRRFNANLTAFCVGATIADNRLIAAVAPVPRAKVAPDGRFLLVYKPSSTTITLRGQLHGRRVTDGKVEISFSTCQGSATFSARRRCVVVRAARPRGFEPLTSRSGGGRSIH